LRKVLGLTAIVLAFSACVLQATVIDSTWVGGKRGEWGNASNWNPNIVPDNDGNTFVVTIAAVITDDNDIDIGLTQSRTINRLDCNCQGDDVDLQKWTSGWVELTIYNGLTNHGNLDIDEINIRGNITNTTGATLGLYEDKFILDGNVYNQVGAMIEVADDVMVEDGNIDNAGVIMLVPNSILVTEHTLHNAGQINVYGGDCGADEIFDNNSTGTITGYGTLHGGADLFRNKGKIYAFGGSLAIGSFGPIINSGLLANKPSASLHITYVIAQGGDFNNQGTIEVNAGGGVAFDYNLVNEPNGVIELLGGTLAATTITQTADANFAGFGGITGDILVESGAKIELTGPTNIVGDVNIPTGATLEISDGQTLITGHTTCDGTIHLIGGTVVFQGGCDCEDCNIINEAGIDRNHFDLNADGIEDFKDFAYFAETWLWQASWY